MKNFFKKLMSSKSQSKYFSETVQRVGKNNAGFSLVELIVVIAIMAILAAVAVIGVSVYIPKAQKQADMTTASDVANALSLYYYSNPEDATDDFVILKYGSNAVAGGTFATEAMKAAYGEKWANELQLSYDGWTSSTNDLSKYYANSSYNGNVDSLLGTVDDLTNQLKDVLADNPTIGGAGFNDYITGLENSGVKVDGNPTASANAAVTYVASNVAELNDEKKQKIVDYLTSIGGHCSDPSKGEQQIKEIVVSAIAAITGETESTLSAASLVYAYAEAFCLYINNPEVTMELQLTDPAKQDLNVAVGEIATEFSQMIVAARTFEGRKCVEYFGIGRGENGEQDPSGTKSETDAWATVSAMGAIKEKEDIIHDNISSSSCFTDVSDYVNAYLSATAQMSKGDILVMINQKGEVSVTPSNALN